jgi:hypothetical protein
MGCRVAVPDMQLKRTACNASQPWIGADTSAARKFVQPLGRIAVPKFFWGGEATRATGNDCYCRSLDPDGCLARSVAAEDVKKRARSATAFGHWNWKASAQAAGMLIAHLTQTR